MLEILKRYYNRMTRLKLELGLMAKGSRRFRTGCRCSSLASVEDLVVEQDRQRW
jgi:hypothetical protein